MLFTENFNKLFSTVDKSAILDRTEVEEKYKWDLSFIYRGDDDWEKDFEWISENIANYKNFEGTLSKSPEHLLECLKFDNEIGIKIERLYLYAMLSKDSDMKVQKYQAMDDRIKSLYTNVSTAGAFIKPELLQMTDEKLLDMICSNNELKVYEHFIRNLIREKSHTLSKEQEKILALAGEIASISYNVFSIFNNAEIQFPKVNDENGKDIEISHARYYAAMYSNDREYRKRFFTSYFTPYINYINTYATLFNGNLKTNIYNAKARNYKSSLEASLDSNNIPVSVYENLVKTCNDNMKPLHRWAALKKKILGIDELHPYDVYVSLFPSDFGNKFEYEKGKEIVLNALKPLGNEYLASIKSAFENRWIDVYETRYKRSGAYSSGTTFGVHPYVLLNWSNLLNDVFTLAHEMGHNMHSYYTGKSQPYPYANYTIFLAEVASTFNESLLLDYLIENSNKKEEKLFLIEKYLNNITATFYRQIMFAEFEMWAYEQTENGAALTSEILSKNYKELYQKYWGPQMIIDKEEEHTWARIPHFYYNFYVYQYATGYAASEVLSKKVKNEGQPAVEKYLYFLKSGSSDYSINILKAAGVDMNSSEPVEATTQKMDMLLNELEKLSGNI
ncbi:MAG: oligoendopeptidase F [Ignavibacteriaceae bacterium]